MAVSGDQGSFGYRGRARTLERDQWDYNAKAWRETLQTIDWETNQVARAAARVEEWHQKHAVQSLALRAGLKKPPTAIQRLAQTHAESTRFLQRSQRRLEELEQAWPKKQLMYQQQLEREGDEIRKAKKFLGVIHAHPEHFQKFWKREEQPLTDRRHRRERDRGRSGWSR